MTIITIITIITTITIITFITIIANMIAIMILLVADSRSVAGRNFDSVAAFSALG